MDRVSLPPTGRCRSLLRASRRPAHATTVNGSRTGTEFAASLLIDAEASDDRSACPPSFSAAYRVLLGRAACPVVVLPRGVDAGLDSLFASAADAAA
jgi:hypothetical protein